MSNNNTFNPDEIIAKELGLNLKQLADYYDNLANWNNESED